MRPISQIVDIIVLGSDRPLRRLIAYYVILGLVLWGLAQFFPASTELLLGKGTQAATPVVEAEALLQDGLASAPVERVGVW